MNYFWVYMLRCSDGSYYVGHTDNIEGRISEHQLGKYSGYTCKRLPFELVFCQQVMSRIEAIEFECKIKKWTRAKKEALIAGNWQSISLLAKKRFD